MLFNMTAARLMWILTFAFKLIDIKSIFKIQYLGTISHISSVQ